MHADYIKDFLRARPEGKINTDTKSRKKLLLGDDTIVIEGKVRKLRFKNLLGGVWEVSLEPLKT